MYFCEEPVAPLPPVLVKTMPIYRDPSAFGGDMAPIAFNNCGEAPQPRPCGSAELPAQDCPVVMDIGTEQPLRLDKIEVGLEIHVSTMFGKTVMNFTNTTSNAVFPLLKFPMKESGSVLYCWAKIGDKFFETNVMSAEQAGKAAKKGKAPKEMKSRPTEGGAEESRGEGEADWQKYNPNCFNLPLGGQIPPNESCTIIVSFFEPLDFTNGAVSCCHASIVPSHRSLRVLPASYSVPLVHPLTQTSFLWEDSTLRTCRSRSLRV
jgi:hypothetical protein